MSLTFTQLRNFYQLLERLVDIFERMAVEMRRYNDNESRRR
jgi:hypothetical protein